MEFAFRKTLYANNCWKQEIKKIITNYSARKQKIKDAQIVSGGSSKVGNFAPTGDAKVKLKAHLKGFWANNGENKMLQTNTRIKCGSRSVYRR